MTAKFAACIESPLGIEKFFSFFLKLKSLFTFKLISGLGLLKKAFNISDKISTENICMAGLIMK